MDADTVEIRDAESGAALQTLRDLASPLIEIAFMLNEHHLASLDDRGTVQVWNVPSRSLLRTFHLDRKVYGDLVAFSPIGQRLASGIWNGNVKVWDTALSSPLSQNLQGSNSNTSMLVFSPNGQTLASLSIDSSIRLWDLATGSLRKRFIAIKYNNSIAFSVDVVKLISLNKQQHILDIWDTESGQSLKGEDRSLIDLADATTRPSYGVGFIDQWVTVNQQRLIRVTPDRRKFSFSTYGTKIAIGSYLGVMTLLDVDLELMRSSIPCPPIAERQPVTICEFYAAVGASGDDGESSNDEDWETVAWDSDSKVDERTTGAIPRRHSI